MYLIPNETKSLSISNGFNQDAKHIFKIFYDITDYCPAYWFTEKLLFQRKNYIDNELQDYHNICKNYSSKLQQYSRKEAKREKRGITTDESKKGITTDESVSSVSISSSSCCCVVVWPSSSSSGINQCDGR